MKEKRLSKEQAEGMCAGIEDILPEGHGFIVNEFPLGVEERRFASNCDRETRFKNVGCSQCGEDFGPGDHGFSHCENHKHLTAI